MLCARVIGTPATSSPANAPRVTQPSDKTLMRRAKRGDQDAFAVLVHRHVDALYGYALRLIKVPSSAEDLVQDTWLTAWAKATRYNPRKANVTTWLHAILYNRFIDIQRKQQTGNHASLDEEAVSDSSNAILDAPYVNDAQLMTINHLLYKLPLNQRSAIVLTHLQGFSNKQAAHIMGINVRALESLLARARAALKQQFQGAASSRAVNAQKHS